MSARSTWTATLSLSVLACLVAPALWGATTPATATQPAVNKYIGSAKCKNCHNSEATGDQHGSWSAAKHAQAFEVLGSDAAKAVAAERGIADPQKDDSCVKCHVTGFGEPAEVFPKKWSPEAGVQCETCHGPGGDHMKARFKAAASGETPEGYQVLPEGEVITSPGVDVCTQCHTPESPSYKPFCFFEARAKVAHLNPLKPRTAEEVAAFGVCPCGAPCPHGEGCPEGLCNLTPAKLLELK